GRIDQQVKLRGFRIELGEIESTLRAAPAVRDAVVLLRHDTPGDPRLVAYVVGEQTNKETNEQPETTTPSSPVATEAEARRGSGQGGRGDEGLRTFLKDRLPAYMLPSAYVMLDALPLTAHGKVDRKALPAPESEGLAPDSLYVAPRTPIEEVLVGIWADVLHLERIGVNANFFELGGHSLLVTQVISRLRATFQVELPLRSLFEAPTVAGLARQIEVARQNMQGIQSPPQPASRDSVLPLSFAQQRLWFLDQLQPNSPAYNIPTAIRLIGRLDVAALKRSLDTIVERHEALRTTFTTLNDGQPVQVITPAQALPLPLTDLEALPEAEREPMARRLATEEVQRPFDLAQGPLLRVSLLYLGAEEHVLLLTMHHIVSDGWSMGVFVRELVTLYVAFSEGTTPALPELPIQYADYAVWQRRWLSGAVLAAQLDYWKQQLVDPPVLDLPTDYLRPAVPSFRGAVHTFLLPAALSADLAALSRREGVTLFMTLLAAWQILLARYSGQSDIVVGSPIANRTRAETEDLIGCFINTLVLRTDLGDNPPFQEVLTRVREVALAAFDYQDLPFEQVVDAVQPERDLSRHPLFQVLFALQNAPTAPFELPNLALAPFMVEQGTVNFDLSLSLTESEAGLAGTLEYAVDLFAGETIGRMVDHFQTLLEGIVRDPGQRLAQLPLLSADERRQLAVDWNTTQATYSRDRCVHELVAAQSARTPEAVALVYASQQLTYRELDQRANQLAHYLRELGVGPEVRVGLCLDRSLELVIGLLGILKAGGAYVPLDPNYPAQRLSFMLEDSQVAVVLSHERLAATLPADRAQIVYLDTAWSSITQLPNTPPESSVTANHLAYVIYTSGSTGTPKGVQVEHGNLLATLYASQQHFGFHTGDTMPWLASVAFDIALFELFNPLIAGGTVIMLDHQQILDLPSLLGTLAECTVFHAVPSLMRQITQAIDASEDGPSSYDHIRMVFTGGDVVPPELLSELQAVFRQAEIRVLYGPTEATIICTSYRVPERSSATQHLIGTPLANAQIRIYDTWGSLAPIGVAGELYIGGAGVTRGYLHRPELTAEKFVELDGQRWYRSGDLARYRPDGNLEFLGRRDAQVKVRGFRVELGEVEAALGQHPAVRASVVILREDGPGGQQLVAYVVENQEPRTKNLEDGGLSPSELRSFLLSRLPEYMVPAAFVFLEALPLTAHGKVDRKALPAPDTARPELAETFAAPQTATETVLAQIWSQVLRREQVGIHDNFFALGGDSILSIQIIARANQAGLRLTPRQLFQHQTIASLAAVAGTASEQTAEQGLVTGPVPLTPIQHYFFAQELPDPHHYNQAMLFEVRPPLDATLLEQAVQQVLAHHDALRLRVERTADGWRQINAGLDAMPLVQAFDLRAVPLGEQAATITQAATQLQTSLDLHSGPLLRVGSFTLGDGQPGRLLLVVHHLAVDTVSWGILLEDLQTAYAQLQRGESVALPPKTTSFQQWAERLHAYAQSETLRQELAYWLASARTTIAPLPVDHPDGVNTLESARSVAVALGEDDTRALLYEVPAVYQTQINDVLLTALAQACAAWTGATTLLVDLEGHGREELFADVDLTRTVGWFTALYPVLLDLRGVAAPGAALKAIKEQLRQIPNRGVGYGVLRYLSRDEATAQLRTLPQAQISFNYWGQGDQAMPTDGLFSPARESSGPSQSQDGMRKHLLEITSIISQGQLHMEWTYSAALHSQAAIEWLAQGYLGALRTLIDHCRAPEAGGYTPSDFPLAHLDQQAVSKLSALLDEIEDDEEFPE
ncbi:MAG TPA: amino acid adenylation domain-containing protein, partial [Herpetosiphonaceae bacterium]